MLDNRFLCLKVSQYCFERLFFDKVVTDSTKLQMVMDVYRQYIE